MESTDWDLWSPDNSDQYALVQDLARMQQDVDDALTSLDTKHSNMSIARFNFAFPLYTDATLASTEIPATQNPDWTTDTSFIISRTGTELTVKRGFYLVSMGFSLTPPAKFTGRTFVEVSGGGVGVRNGAVPNVGEESVGVMGQLPIFTDGGVIAGRTFKTSGGPVSVSGSLIVTKLL